MMNWASTIQVYLHRDPVDFRKQINGLAILVEDAMNLSPFSTALFVFCNKQRTQIKALYWDNTGFALWQKRLEKDKFKWPRKVEEATVILTAEQWGWLLKGFDVTQLQPHSTLHFDSVG